LQTKTADGIGGTWAGIRSFSGGDGDIAALVGTDITNNWYLSGIDSGTVGSYTFADFRWLVGGDGNDTFHFADGARVLGSIWGGLGTNALDYSAYSTGVYVNLQTLTATSTGTGGIDNIQNVTGSGGAGNDVLVGDANANVLLEKAAKTGTDLIIGGGGADTLNAGGGGDILIAGTTDYDLNAAALNALLATWSRTDLSYSARVAALLAGVSYTDGSGTHTAALTPDGTVHHAPGSAPATLVGGGGLDFYFAALTDVVKNQNKGEILATL
jgi:Ca2+-binding RTX toxin-like protein